MKEKIHPKYEECTVTCGCGNSFVTRGTKSTLNVEICSNCHPFYTGKQKFVDTAGRVEKFQRRHAWSEEAAQQIVQKGKEASKRTSRKPEKVTVGVPKIRRKKGAAAEEEEVQEAPATGKGGRRGPRAASGGAAPEGAPESKAPEGSPAPAADAGASGEESK